MRNFQSSCLQLCCYFFLLYVVLCTKYHNGSEITRNIIGSRYESTIPPFYTDGKATLVKIQLYLENIHKIDEKEMTLDCAFFLRMYWQDKRLQFANDTNYSGDDYVVLDPRKIADSVWLPDLYFRNERETNRHDFVKRNELLRIYKDGNIYHSSRLTVKFSCPMSFKRYPLDEQICEIRIESFSYSTKEITFEWYNSTYGIRNKESLSKQSTVFKIEDIYAKMCTSNFDSDAGKGNFPCLSAEFHLQRDIKFYIVETFVPSSLIVILSWVSFLINHEAVPARLSLGVITVLTIVTQASGVNNRLPPVNYIKAIDVWLCTCILLVFAGLLEYAIVHIRSQHESKHGSTRIGPKQVDGISIVIFPLAFIIFNCCYWYIYLTMDDH